MRINIKLLALLLMTKAIGYNCSEDSTLISITNTEITQVTGKDSLLVFEDNFNQEENIPDKSRWVLAPHTDAASWSSYLSDSYDQAYIENGMLILKGEKTKEGYKSGGIQTRNKFNFTYGIVEVKAKFKTAKGGWPAIWMMPSYSTEDWPYGGEIDIMEQINNDGFVYQTLHSYYINILNHEFPLRRVTVSYRKNEFNIYLVEWNPQEIIFKVNGLITLTYPNLYLSNEETMRQWPFNKPFYLILNYTLGGKNTWPGDIDDSQLPGIMLIDWVKIYRLPVPVL
ncbi:glycoside hydrolase family 16 protein [uncultured Bacteroides sp.]|uniref:glycoside hydrolase family 16 protein n=1 Tax=uncultured Bacteroides sp. TaxID=162156 RepID=UPI002AAB45B6|nr:glycoside hydrolase family 16 protein [uncultured Bacteroides sp.]